MVFGLCGFFWNRLPLRLHQLLTPVGCPAAAAMYILLGLDLASGTHGGAAFQVILVVPGGALALGFSPLVTHSLVHVPVTAAADASGLLTTAIQLGQAVGVAVFGSLFLTLDARGGPGPGVSGHAIAVTLDWVAVATAFGVLAAVPPTRTALAARRGSPPPPRLSPIGGRSRAALRVLHG